jgi:2-polyprenyl-6-methoxyphenol hydroxylase-like FAD-dependent oxidoreductase
MDYDVSVIGGGLGGAALAKVLAERGHRVIVLERESRFTDRVRGEQMHPWGVTALRTLGLYEPLLAACGHQTRAWNRYAEGRLVAPRDLAATNPHGVGSFHFFHPEMQETLIRLAAEAGAEICRGATVDEVRAGSPALVRYRYNGRESTISSRLAVAADGRASAARDWGGFAVRRDPDTLVVAGLLLENSGVPDDGVHVSAGSPGALLMAPQGNRRTRAYFIYRKASGMRTLSGERHQSEFLAACRSTGAPAEWLDDVKACGPLAQFNGADHWVDHPAKKGLVLIGDAAASPDPSWGTGLSLTLLDVVTLGRCLNESDDWDLALDRYAQEHDRYYAALHAVEKWFTDFVWTPGKEADERRAALRPRLAQGTGMPDITGLGPESPIHENGPRLWRGMTPI